MQLMFLAEYFESLTVQEGVYREVFDPRIKACIYNFTRVSPSVFQFVFRLHTKQKPYQLLMTAQPDSFNKKNRIACFLILLSRLLLEELASGLHSKFYYSTVPS